MIGSFEGDILILKYTNNLWVKIGETSVWLSLPVVFPSRVYVAVEAASLLDPEVRGGVMVITSGVAVAGG